jgi:hypothetical protein
VNLRDRGSSAQDLFGFQKYEDYENEPFDKYTFINMNEVLAGDISLTGSFNWQFDNSNFLKAGFEFRYNTLDERESRRFPSFKLMKDTGSTRDSTNFHPIQVPFIFRIKWNLKA